MATMVEQFISEFVVKVDDKQVTQYDKKLTDTEKEMERVENKGKSMGKKLGESFKSMGGHVDNALGKIFNLKNAIIGAVAGTVVDKFATQADEMLKFADANGVAVETVGELQFAMKRVGGAPEDLNDGLSKLNILIGQAAQGVGTGVGVFEDFGISAKDSNGHIKNATDLMGELHGKFNKMGKEKQIGFAEELGLNEGMLKLLQTSDKELSNLTKQAQKYGVMTKHQGQVAGAFNDSLANLQQVFQSIFYTLMEDVVPVIQKFTDWIGSALVMIREHSVALKFFIGILGALGIAFKLVTTEATLADIAIMAIPLAIVAIAAVIALVAEDFYQFFTGGQSVVGGLVDKFKEFGTSIKQGFSNVFEMITDPFKRAIQFIKDKFFNVVNNGLSKIKGFFGFGGGSDIGNTKTAPTSNQTTNQAIATTNNSTGGSVNVGTVTVQTNATSGVEVAQGLSQGLNDHLKTVNQNTKGGRQ